jgi:hypothetical protein
MTGKQWTTNAQYEFLKSYLPQYIATKGRDLGNFWKMLNHEWFLAFPEKDDAFPGDETLTAEQEEILNDKLEKRRQVSIVMHYQYRCLTRTSRLQKLQTWFRWRTNRTVRKQPGPIVLALPKTRQLQDTEVYSKLFYESKLKEKIAAEIAEQDLSPRDVLAKTREVTKWEWMNESESVKEQVREMKKEYKRDAPAEGSTPTPEQYQSAINSLSQVGNTFLEHIKQTTGWTGFMVLGGPNPGIGGEISIGSYVSLELQLEFVNIAQ